VYLAACRFHYLVRAAGASAAGKEARAHREGALLALRTLAGRVEPPFGAPPPTAVDPFAGRAEREDALLDTAGVETH
jgi:hypothetical protein